ncbi:hypothetical protein BVC80_8585g13 [Macleaya cordata]|uniref:Epidermal patterning factor-like protein n=1 Tax=Macleaya cordata TaxID=56857 RepID=A0A200RAC8_MACCD|nr:hypothetical protein BVC80_8585g13 [Macleaya cordata]
MDWKITKQSSFMFRTSLFFFSISICIFSLYALFNTISTRTVCLDIRNPTGTKSDFSFQELEKTEEKIEDQEEEEEEDQILYSSNIIRRSLFHYSLMSRLSSSSSRRFLSVPGSSPPRCTSKCGKCTPCKPVHVPVPPGTPVTTEYYPEAWRCKCGNKLYMP